MVVHDILGVLLWSSYKSWKILPEERLFEVEVRAGGEIVVLQVSLSVELDVSRLHLPVFHVHLIADQDNRDLLAHSHDVLVPFGKRTLLLCSTSWTMMWST